MKKYVKSVFVAAIVAVAGYNMYQSQSAMNGMSELALANVEALASGESGSFNCWWDSVDYMICYNGGDWLGCPCGSHNW